MVKNSNSIALTWQRTPLKSQLVKLGCCFGNFHIAGKPQYLYSISMYSTLWNRREKTNQRLSFLLDSKAITNTFDTFQQYGAIFRKRKKNIGVKQHCLQIIVRNTSENTYKIMGVLIWLQTVKVGLFMVTSFWMSWFIPHIIKKNFKRTKDIGKL